MGALQIIVLLFLFVNIAKCNNCFQKLKKSYTKYCIEKNDKIFVGDFNGDGRSDLMCSNQVGKKLAIRYASGDPFQPTEWSVDKYDWCTGSNDVFLVGDFNGDKRDDLLCHNTANGYKTYNFADANGRFSHKYAHGQNMRWCGHANAKVHIADFTGDGRADMLCNDPSKRFWFAKSDSSNRNWRTFKYHLRSDCHGDIFVGDYNNDKKADVFCMDKNKKLKSLLLFDGTNFHRVYDNFNNNLAWCGGYILSGDFNGDGRSDIMCHNYDPEGPVWVMKNNHPRNSRYFTEESTYISHFCQKNDKTQFFLGDFTGDGKTDLICQDVTGNWQVSASRCG